MNDRELLELIAAQVGILTTDMKEVKEKVTTIDSDIQGVKNQITKIEIDHGKKLETLFDGYTQINNKLDRIEEEVAKHEEVILKKVK